MADKDDSLLHKIGFFIFFYLGCSLFVVTIIFIGSFFWKEYSFYSFIQTIWFYLLLAMIFCIIFYFVFELEIWIFEQWLNDRSNEKAQKKALKKKTEMERKYSIRGIYQNSNFKLKKIICFHCLKSILLKDLSVACPFCETNFSSENSDVPAVIFDRCPECDAEIRYFDCIYCGKSIDTLAAYNEKELEKKRYE